MQLSVVIPTFNSQRYLPRVLSSVSFSKEVLVIDSGSTDLTEQIVREFPNTRFIKQAWLGFGPQRNKALEQVTGEFVLFLDSDEVVDPQFSALLSQYDPKEEFGFSFDRINYYQNTPLYSASPEKILRIGKVGFCKYTDESVHERLLVDGKVSHLKGVVHHYSYGSIEEYLQKIDRYTQVSSQSVTKTSSIWIYFYIFLLPLDAWTIFIFRGEWRNGAKGLVHSFFTAFSHLVKKLKGIERNNPINE